MPADRRDLALRIAQTTPADTSRGLNFNRLFQLVRDRLGDDAARACDPDGKGSRTDFFSYPVADYLRIAWAAADRLEPSLGSVEAVWEELGRRTVAGFLSSVLGRTLFAIAGKDARRLVSAGPSGYRSAVSYGERTVRWVGDRHAMLEFRRDFMVPAFHRAVMLTALEASDARSPRVEARAVGLLDSDYDVTWE
jgi:uncharacterized protein (TIGR02265 family)